jgi:hypothetical protein
MIRRIFQAAGVLVLLLSLVWSAILISNSIKEKRVSDDWAKEFVSLESFPERFPTTKANQSALELEKLSAELGIDLAPKKASNRARPSSAKEKLLKDLSKEIKAVLNKRLTEGISSDFRISEELQKYLAANENNFSQIVDYTLNHEPAKWEIDISKHIHAPIPNLVGQIDLQNLLNLRAVQFFQQSRTNDAEKALEASWKINQQLFDRPETIPYLVGVNIFRTQAGNLRQIPVEYATWHSRLTDSKIHDQFWTVFESDVWTVLKAAKEGALLDQEHEKPTVINQIWAPYARSMTLDYAKVMLQFLTDLKRRDPCLPKKIQKNIDKELFSQWNLVWRGAFIDPGRWWNREARLRLDLELTDKVLQIKEALHKTNSTQQNETMKSDICPGENWTYVRDNDSYSISFSKKIDWSKADEIPEGTLILPQTYNSSSPTP